VLVLSDFYKAIFDRCGDALVIADDDGTIVTANEAAARLFGRPLEQVVGQRIVDLVHREASTTRRLWQGFRDDGHQRGEIELKRPDASPLPAEYTATADVVPGLHLSVMRDITARREAEAARDRLLANVSHELRSPLSAILGWAELLQHEQDPQVLAEGLSRIARNARAQARLVSDLLDMARAVHGELDLHPSQVDVGAAIREAVEAERATPQAAQRHVTQAVEGAPLLITADPDRLGQVLRNLLTNAVKFTSPGDRIHVTATAAGEGVRLEVTDTGRGIAQEDLGELFEPFRRSASSSAGMHGGLGLGLAIVRSIVEQHGGRVTAHSEGLGKGATVQVWLPAGAPQLASAPQGSSDFAPPEADLHGVKLLLCDDEPDGMTALAASLARLGATVCTASSGAEALAVLEAERPHVLLSDLSMPEMDGYTLLRSIRALPADEGGNTPALAITGHAGPNEAARALRDGFAAHLEKPVDVATVVAHVRRLLG
jgi:PAS domain S-box-containing protein